MLTHPADWALLIGAALGSSSPSSHPNSADVGFVGPLGCSRLPQNHAPGVEANHIPPDAPAYLPDVGSYLGRAAQPSTQSTTAANANAAANADAAAAGPAATVAGLSGATLHTFAPPSRVARLA